MSTCPAESQIVRFLAAELDEADARQIEIHIEQCPECKRKCESALSQVDVILAALKDAANGKATASAGTHSGERGEQTVSAASSSHFARMPAIPDYILRRRLGRGAFGEVWLAENKNTGVYHAVKLIPPSVAMHMEQEAIRNLERLTSPHPCRVDIRHVGRTDECFYYVMALADSYVKAKTFTVADYEPRTLQSDLKRRGRLPLSDALRIVMDVLEALADLHAQGLLHGDVKPANIVFIDDKPRLADFGLVTRASGDKLGAGTPRYAPPEGIVDHSGDLYTVGRMLLELVTGTLSAEPLPVSPDVLPADEAQTGSILRILQRATSSEPAVRFQTAEQFQRALHPLLEPEPVAVTAQWSRRQLLGFGGGAIVLLTALAWGWRHQYGSKSALRAHVEIWVEDRDGRTLPRVLDETMLPLVPGQSVRLALRLNRPAYAVVALVSGDGEDAVQIVYPESGMEQRPVAELSLPASGAWRLTPQAGMLSFVVLLRDGPIDDLQNLHAVLEPLANLSVDDPGVLLHVSGHGLETRRNPEAEKLRGFPPRGDTVDSTMAVLEQLRIRLRQDFDEMDILVISQLGDQN